MAWRLAQSLITLRDQIDAMYPNRDKRTDGALSGYPGSISGHNPNADGVVCAFDITTGDYPGGISMAQSQPLADAIRLELLTAPRGLYTYLIHHMEPPYVPSPGAYIAHGGPSSLWQWVPYTGDPHTSHIHVSVDWDIAAGENASGQDPYDMTDPWNIGGVSTQSETITTIQEDVMTPEQAQQLKAVFDAIFNGGPSMKYGASLQALVDDIPRRVWAAQVLRDGKTLSVLQDNAYTGTDVKTALAKIDSLTNKVNGLGTPGQATATVDVNALAAELKPLLPNADVAAELVAAIRSLTFTAK